MFLEQFRWLAFAYYTVTSNAIPGFYNSYKFWNLYKFSQGFMRGGREFETLGPKDLMLLLPKLTRLTLGISSLSLY